MFLGFANFHRRFIKNFNRIVVPLTSMLGITNKSTGNGLQSTQANNQDAPDAAGRPGGDGIDDRIENLSNSTMVKRSFGAKFLTFGAKEAFNCLQKAFIKAPILRHFDPERHIRIETNVSRSVIIRILS